MNLELNGENNRSKRDAFIKVTRETRATAVIILYSNNVIDQKIDYIHQNPVRAGIVTESSFYTYSSACLDSPLKIASI